MMESTSYRDGIRAVLAFRSAFDAAEKTYGPKAFCPATTDIQSPEMAAMREAGMKLHISGGLDAMVLAACALADSDPRRFFGLGVLLSVVWAGVGNWPVAQS
jgi:hypothetical protein